MRKFLAFVMLLATILTGQVGVAVPASAAEEPVEVSEPEDHDIRHSNAEDAHEHGVEMFNPDEVLSLQAYRLPGSSDGKPRLAMTIDDGTSRVTNYILDGLERLERQGLDLSNLVITWCINGREPVPGTIQRILDAGHAICSHGYYHLDLTSLSCSEIIENVSRIEEFVNSRVSKPIEINSVRPAWGRINSRVIDCLESHGYAWFNWTIDTGDYKYPGQSVIYGRMARAKDGDIVLMHDSADKWASADALLQMVENHYDDYEWVPLPGSGMYEACETPGPFEDVCGDDTFVNAITWAKENNVTYGCNTEGTLFCGNRAVKSGEFFALYVRGMNIKAASRDHFVDDNGHTFEGSTNALAERGTLLGCNPPENTRSCIDSILTRGRLSVVMARDLGLPTADRDYFVDDDGHFSENANNMNAAAGILKGCNPPENDRVCPNDPVRRNTGVTMVKRGVDYLNNLG